jgi:glycosidase
MVTMFWEAIIHEQTRDYVYPIERNKLAIRLKIKRKDAKSCTLIYWNRHKRERTGEQHSEMKCYARDKMFDYYETIINTKEVTRYIKYFFQINDGINTFFLNYHGISSSVPKDGFFEYLYTNENDVFKVPDWVKGSIFYQIFPERFCNGDKNNDPKSTEQWGSKPTRENFMGGDLKGIIQKIHYLKDLGINALYLNPIFEASANHKYDTINYFKIDPHFGDLNDFKTLIHKCHSYGIKVILDGVFNHCGYFSDQFQDVVKNGQNSKYKDWFYIESFPVDKEKLNYECVGYYKWMPKLRMSNPEVRSFILKIAKYWIEEGNIDGWRLDVADEIDFTFWQEFRKLVKSIKPECFILAETWKENRDMLRGDQMDSVMNYLFRDAVVDFFAKKCINSLEFDSRINKFLGVYPSSVHHSLFNLIGSHDTERFLTLSNGDSRRLKAAAAFQLCFPGISSIYYGDEVGLDGENDPDCRKAMEWDEKKQDQKLLEWYKKLIRIRKSKSALKLGIFKCNYCNSEDNVYAFFREINNERVYIVINNADSTIQIILPVKEQSCGFLTDEISGKIYRIEQLDNSIYYNDDIIDYSGTLHIQLKPYQVCILCK